MTTAIYHLAKVQERLDDTATLVSYISGLVAQMLERHTQELAAYELTISNLRAAQGGPDIRALFWQLSSKLLKLPRYSFLSPQGGGVVRVPDSCGRWIEIDDAAWLCEVGEIDAMIAAAPCAGCGETCKRAKLCATCAGEIAAAPQPAAQPERQINTVTATAPKEIWLRVRDDATHCDKPFPDVHGPMVTWGHESIMACEVHYIRADVAGAAQPERGQIVVTKNEAGRIVAVTRQDEDGKILEVIATDIRFEREPEPTNSLDSLYFPIPVAYQYNYPDGTWRCSFGDEVNGCKPTQSRALYARKDGK